MLETIGLLLSVWLALAGGVLCNLGIVALISYRPIKAPGVIILLMGIPVFIAGLIGLLHYLR